MTAGIKVLDGHMHLLTTETEGEARHWLLTKHRRILEALRISDEDQRKILGENMARLLGISW